MKELSASIKKAKEHLNMVYIFYAFCKLLTKYCNLSGNQTNLINIQRKWHKINKFHLSITLQVSIIACYILLKQKWFYCRLNSIKSVSIVVKRVIGICSRKTLSSSG